MAANIITKKEYGQMSEAYLGEIRMFAGNYAPDGWAVCNGQTTFALPDLQGRLPIHTSPQYFLGRKGGSETVSLTLAELPAHTHPVGANSIANDAIYSSPENNVWGITSFGGYQTNTASDIVQIFKSANNKNWEMDLQLI